MSESKRAARGFTLLEALASAALLSALAAAIVPLLRDLRNPDMDTPSCSLDELSQAADALLASETRASLAGLRVGETFDLPWPDAVAREESTRSETQPDPSIRVTRVASSASLGADQAWWVFRSVEGQEAEAEFVLRYGAIDLESGSKSGGGP